MNSNIVLANQGMTVVMLCLTLFLLIEWFPGTVTAVKRALDRHQVASPSCWLMVAITISHIALVLDNTYWLIAWSGLYLDTEWGEKMIDFGTVANTVSRQGLGIIGVYLHIHAAQKNIGSFDHFKTGPVRWMLLISGVFGCAYAGLLFYIK